jgi:hypothetical protein
MSLKEYYRTKASRNKSLIRALLDIFIPIIIYTYLVMAISLILFSLPLVLYYYFFTYKQIDLPKIYGYVAFILITIFLALIIIRKYGVDTFWKAMIRYNVFYKGKSGKYYKWFVYFIIFFILISLLVAYLQYLFGK